MSSAASTRRRKRARVFGCLHADPDQPAGHRDALRLVSDGDRCGDAIGARVDPRDRSCVAHRHPYRAAAGRDSHRALADRDGLSNSVRAWIDARHGVVARVGHPHRARVGGDRDGIGPRPKPHVGPSGLLVNPPDDRVLGVDRPDGSVADGDRVRAGQRPAPDHLRPPGKWLVSRPARCRAGRSWPPRPISAGGETAAEAGHLVIPAAGLGDGSSEVHIISGREVDSAVTSAEHVKEVSRIDATAPGRADPHLVRRSGDVTRCSAIGRSPADALCLQEAARPHIDPRELRAVRVEDPEVPGAGRDRSRAFAHTDRLDDGSGARVDDRHRVGRHADRMLRPGVIDDHHRPCDGCREDGRTEESHHHPAAGRTAVP